MAKGEVALFATAVALCVAAGCTAPRDAADPSFALLYSTVGYEAGGTKRALVRALGDAVPEPTRSEWSVLDAYGNVLDAGKLRARGEAFGSPLWEVDFSGVGKGAGLRLRVRLVAGGNPPKAVELTSLPFPVERALFTRRMALGLSLHNAELRHAPEAMGAGYFDCNSQMGEAYSHAMFAAGLVELERRRGEGLASPERIRLHDEIHRAIDYVLALHDGATGEIANQHASRPGGNPGAFNTQEGVYGLVQYLALGSAADPARSAEIERRARTSLRFLESSGEVYPELGAAAWARLYASSGRPDDLEAAVRHAEMLVASFDPQTRFRHPLRGVPWFEGLALLAPRVDAKRRERWQARARAWSRALREVASRNAYGVVPPLGEAEWADASGPPVSRVEHAFFANAHFLTTSLDALLLDEITGEREMEGLASAGLQWVTGVNPGLAAAAVAAPSAAPDEPSIVAASMIVNGPGRHVRPWTKWWWKGLLGTPGALSAVNGFVALPQRGLLYDTESWPASETFIRTDALFLRSALRYEDDLIDR